MNYLSDQEKEELGKLAHEVSVLNTWSCPFGKAEKELMAEFIAKAANPAVIQSLLEELEDVKAERDRVYALDHERCYDIAAAEAERDKLRELICLDTNGVFLCVLEKRHPGDHKAYHSSGGVVGWRNKSEVQK